MRGVGETDCHCANRVLTPTSGGVFLCVGLKSRMDDVRFMKRHVCLLGSTRTGYLLSYLNYRIIL